MIQIPRKNQNENQEPEQGPALGVWCGNDTRSGTDYRETGDNKSGPLRGGRTECRTRRAAAAAFTGRTRPGQRLATGEHDVSAQNGYRNDYSCDYDHHDPEREGTVSQERDGKAETEKGRGESEEKHVAVMVAFLAGPGRGS